jgi:predicted DNA binding CopG/RHH family protein
MRKHYDFSGGVKNPYAKMFKRQITIRLESKVIEYFKEMSRESGMPYQNLINMYLKDCVDAEKKPKLKWAS